MCKAHVIKVVKNVFLDVREVCFNDEIRFHQGNSFFYNTRLEGAVEVGESFGGMSRQADVNW